MKEIRIVIQKAVTDTLVIRRGTYCQKDTIVIVTDKDKYYLGKKEGQLRFIRDYLTEELE